MPKKYYYRKPYRIKRKKPILRRRFFRLGILVLAAIGGISYFLFFSGIFQIEKVIVTGESKVSKEAIESLVSPQNIFLIDISKIRKDILDRFPQIAKAEIHRGFPGTLNISVRERLAVASWCDGENNCFLVDNEGVIFGEAPAETNLVKIAGAREMLGKEKIAKILEIQGKLKDDLGITTTQALIAPEERLNIETSEGWEIYFKSDGDIDWQLQELGLVLEKQITPAKRKKLEYIDLRFSRIFYK